MALTDDSGMNTTMLVTPTNSGFGNNGGFGDMGSGWWIILLFILLGGWGNNNGNGGGFGGGYNYVQEGFNQNAIMNGITNITGTLTNGFSEVQQTLCNGFSQAEIANNARQIANMQTAFNAQTAITGGMNDIAMGLQNCCCENRANIADLKYTVATENCADRYEAAQNTRDIIDSQTRGTQAILDKLCSLELDNYRRENDQLRTQLNMANLAASQTAQTAQIREGQNASVNALVNELRSCPIPSQPVYGSQPIFSCPQTQNNCGCGCGNF